MVSAFVGQGRPGRDEGPSQREPALGRRPSTGRPRARTTSGRRRSRQLLHADDPYRVSEWVGCDVELSIMRRAAGGVALRRGVHLWPIRRARRDRPMGLWAGFADRLWLGWRAQHSLARSVGGVAAIGGR